jgi:hypothetical protein
MSRLKVAPFAKARLSWPKPVLLLEAVAESVPALNPSATKKATRMALQVIRFLLLIIRASIEKFNC